MDGFSFIGGVPHILVSDCCVTAVNRGEVGVTILNLTYESFATHHGTARARKLRVKSMVESGEDLVERWIVAPSHRLTSTRYPLVE